ncbi:hypothetical protein C4D60_Mb07t06980 [Musa balbisiana]|uniref:BAG domain-containing protein n=1 Tax=Musa balbisiana TaxID=52838 RepID=A0A4S8JDI1_MUSBA|nr:hypothetical protein C4D60_Mb07t06980 [Musa balbisiana]
MVAPSGSLTMPPTATPNYPTHGVSRVLRSSTSSGLSSAATMDSYTDNTYYYYSSTSFYYDGPNDHTTRPNSNTAISFPIDSPDGTPTAIPVRLPASVTAAAAIRIQSAYRGHLVQTLVGQIRAVDAEAARMEQRIRRQETVDAVRRDERERLRVSEGLMALLLRLDSVPGIYPAVRELRRAVARRIVALQEVLDAVLAAAPVTAVEGIPASWDEILQIPLMWSTSNTLSPS